MRLWVMLLLIPFAVAEADDDWLDLDLFLAQPRVREVVLSPDGERIAYMLREESGVLVGMLDPANGERRERIRSKSVESLHWSTDGAGLFLETPRRVGYMPADTGRPVLIAELDELRRQQFLGVDPVLPRHILISEEAGDDHFRLLRVDARGQTEIVYENHERIRSFLLGDDGRVAFLKGTDGLEQVLYQVDGDQGREILRCDALDACIPVAVDASGRLLLRARLNGDLWRLVALDLKRPLGEITTVHRDPQGLADLMQVALDPRARQPLFAMHHADVRRLYALDPAVEDHLAVIERRFPDRDLTLAARRSGRYWLIEERGSRLHHARYHVYDTRASTWTAILEDERAAVDALPEERLVDKRFLTYRASDGMEIHGFLAVPRGVDPRRAPLVVWVHGGPWNHVHSGFSAYGQFLVNRGYVVFEPNFRGSTGYGFAYLDAAQGDFGDGRVQQDIVDGVDHVLAQGFGDPARVVIFGHSFGGFSALGGLAFTPEKFVAGIASAPPINLARAYEDMDETRTLANGIPQNLALRRLLVDLDDPHAVAEMRRRSPEARLAATARPLLIFAGGRDDRVDVVDVKHYAAALSSLGKDVSLLIDDDEGHSRVGWQSSRAFLYLVERFLAHHAGGATRALSDPVLIDYVELNLRLTSPSLFAALEAAPEAAATRLSYRATRSAGPPSSPPGSPARPAPTPRQRRRRAAPPKPRDRKRDPWR